MNINRAYDILTKINILADLDDLTDSEEYRSGKRYCGLEAVVPRDLDGTYEDYMDVWSNEGVDNDDRLVNEAIYHLASLRTLAFEIGMRVVKDGKRLV